MAEIIATRRKSVETKEAQKQAVEALAERNDNTAKAAIQDCIHIITVATAKWNNADIPMSMRQKWQEIAVIASQLKSSLLKLAKIEEIVNGCYTIDPITGQLRRASNEEIYRALDKTPIEQV